MIKWKKLAVGGILLGGFIFYTQFAKSAEPAWKVNEKQFHVVDSFNEGMEKEYTKFEELRVVDRYKLVKKINKTIPLEKELRTLTIERVWNLEGRLYILYSVDLKERDKNAQDVPRLLVKNMQLSNEKDEEFSFQASDNFTADSGFVFKHRLYRSMFLVPNPEKLERDDWSILTDADHFELQNLQVFNRDGFDKIKNIGFKVSSENILEKVLESSPIHKQFTYDGNKKAEINAYEILLYSRQFAVNIPRDDKDLIGFSGWIDQPGTPFSWDLVGTPEKGFSLPTFEEQLEQKNSKKKKAITIDATLYKDKRSYSWTIPKEDIVKMNSNPDEEIVRNEPIKTDNNYTFIYEGLRIYNGKPSIQISAMKKEKGNHMTDGLLPGSYFADNGVKEEYERSFKKNILHVFNSHNKALKNFDLFNTEDDLKTQYFITFFKEEINNGALNTINIPEETLTISISDLVYSKLLPNPVTITYKIPKMKATLFKR
ncbi:hypothetical protein [Fictibacillus barbaricus]|uniref:Uncharacterized protein n=1 Tax=Fictibacillus barbaricus TaxID=182136 RepID=A0ABU1TYQ2_9BACL|nr:hypothetical protein [Fictibacillus barbaricus]MDR7072298.1 hypothetical protein [Fictibacillus barbaricus]